MSREQKQPYVRFFASDWLAGTRGMKANEVGIYITLIAMMYERCEPLPEDHRRLARQCGSSPSSFKAVLDILVEDGKITRIDGGLWNNRVEKEFEWREKNSQQSREAASERWKKHNKNNDRNLRTQSERNATAMPTRAIKPETRNQKPDSTPKPPKGASRRRALPENFPDKQDKARAVEHWRAEGVADLLGVEIEATAFRDHHEARGSKMASWSAAWSTWFRNAVKFKREKGAVRQLPTTQDPPANDAEWIPYIEGFYATGRWHSRCGPKPGEPGCFAPPHLIDKHRPQGGLFERRRA